MSMPSADVPVAIVGAGPVGLALALGLARLGVDSVVLEREPRLSEHSRAPVVHMRTREALRRWKAEEPLLALGTLVRRVTVHEAPHGRPLLSVDLTELEDEVSDPGVIILEQSEIERLLAEEVTRSGRCQVRFDAEVTDVAQDADGVTVSVRRRGRASTLRADLLVGCDGASSTVRQRMGLELVGGTYSVRAVLADVRLGDEREELPWPRLRSIAGGLTAAARLRPGLWRILRLEPQPRRTPESGPVEDPEIWRHVADVLGTGPVEVVWASRFRLHHRAAPRFRSGRVLLAGDAAHLHSPAGGQGMNAGIQDAENLAWKLASVLAGDGDADALLDSYEVERRGVVVGEITAFTDRLTRVYLEAPSWVRDGALMLLRASLRFPRLRRRGLRRMSMLDLVTPPSPLLEVADRAAGLRLPDPLLTAADGRSIRLHDLLPSGPALLRMGARNVPAPPLPAPVVARIGAGGLQDGTGLLRRLAGDESWLLVRPDGVIAWARRGDEGLAEAVGRALGG